MPKYYGTIVSKIINNINDKHIDIQIKVLGERPGNGPLSQEK